VGLLSAENIVLTTKVTWEVIILFLWRKISIELKLFPKKYIQALRGYLWTWEKEALKVVCRNEPVKIHTLTWDKIFYFRQKQQCTH
jgi:hypothetical protein